MSDAPDYQAAPVTVGRARRFYQLLCDLGVDDLLDEAERKRDAQVTGRPVDIAEQAAHDAGETDEDVTVSLDVNGFLDALLREGKIEELADIVLALEDDQDPADVPLQILNEAVAVFMMAYAELISTLAGTAGVTTSA